MFRKLAVAALVSTSLLAFVAPSKAANIPSFTGAAGGGCSEASQLVPCLNQVIQGINSGVGALGSSPAQATTTGTTIQALGTVTIPAGTLANPGQAARVKCFASDAGGAGSDVLTVQVGSSAAFAVTATAATAGAIDVDVIVYKTGSNTQQILSKGQFNATPTAQTIVAGANADTAPINVVCSGTTATTVGDMTLRGMYVEQIK